MSYRGNPADRLRLTSLSMEDWIFISAALALGAAVFILIFHLLAWLAGWPGPFLWFGTESRISDILTAAGAILVSTFLFNLFGAASFYGMASLFRRFRRSKA